MTRAYAVCESADSCHAGGRREARAHCGGAGSAAAHVRVSVHCKRFPLTDGAPHRTAATLTNVQIDAELPALETRLTEKRAKLAALKVHVAGAHVQER